MSDFKNAHQAVKRAIETGKLPPIDSVICADCGEAKAEEYHHTNGYEKEHWLNVTPLCLSCHGKTRRTYKVPLGPSRCHQCEAMAKNGQRCPVWAMAGSIYCAAHALQAKNLIHYTEAVP